MKRYFIGLPLSEEARRGVRGVMKVLGKKHWKVRWEPEEKWHITLTFLGETYLDQMMPVKQETFTLKFKGLRRFPEGQRIPRIGERVSGRMVKTIRLHPKDTIVLPKIIWLGLKGDLQALHRLHRSISAGLRAKGIEDDEKSFKPHITLGKIKSECLRGEKLEIAKEIEKNRNMEIKYEWLVDRVVLYESTLLPEGSRYWAIDEVKLGL